MKRAPKLTLLLCPVNKQNVVLWIIFFTVTIHPEYEYGLSRVFRSPLHRASTEGGTQASAVAPPSTTCSPSP
jgi:hypothetical protein